MGSAAHRTKCEEFKKRAEVSVSPLPMLINQLKEGDIVTHMFAPPPNSALHYEDRSVDATTQDHQ